MNSGKCDLLETTCWLFITRAGTSTHWIDQNQKLQIDTDSNNHHHHSKGTAIWLFVIRYYQLKCFVRSQIILVQLLVLETSTFCMMMLCFKMDVCRDQRWIQTCAFNRVDVTQNRLMQSLIVFIWRRFVLLSLIWMLVVEILCLCSLTCSRSFVKSEITQPNYESKISQTCSRNSSLWTPRPTRARRSRCITPSRRLFRACRCSSSTKAWCKATRAPLTEPVRFVFYDFQTSLIHKSISCQFFQFWPMWICNSRVLPTGREIHGRADQHQDSRISENRRVSFIPFDWTKLKSLLKFNEWFEYLFAERWLDSI